MKSTKSILEKFYSGERLVRSDALTLLESGRLQQLGQAADWMRQKMHPDGKVSFLVDRNINYTNVCVARCTFCNFYRRSGDYDGYVLSSETIFKKIEETLSLGGTGILMQGGMHPELKIDYYENLLSSIRDRYPTVHLHCFSPPEIVVLARLSKISLRESIRRLKAAGLQSIPGGGAEILAERMRQLISPGKCTVQQWLEVMRLGHQAGLPSTATMMVGAGETLQERVEHLDRIRSLQDETKGFVAFIPWNVQLQGTPMQKTIQKHMPPVEYLSLLAISRIYLDNIPNIQVSWLTQGLQLGQIALHFGANDVGSIMIEENVISTAGASHEARRSDLIQLILDAGFVPVQRDSIYSSFRKIA